METVKTFLGIFFPKMSLAFLFVSLEVHCLSIQDLSLRGKSRYSGSEEALLLFYRHLCLLSDIFFYFNTEALTALFPHILRGIKVK